MTDTVLDCPVLTIGGSMTRSDRPKQATFQTTLTSTGKNTGIVVPAEVIDSLAAGKRPPVLVDVNGYQYRNTVGVMDGRSMVSVSAAVRKATGLAGGDPITVTLTVAGGAREVLVPDDLEKAFAANPRARAFFGTLSNSLQRFHIDNITGAKAPETRQRRIDKAIARFLDGKPR
jgi:Bacteriocin-protection, YdeI or OmpD-Associated/Domain of unknown function (DUF1905)